MITIEISVTLEIEKWLELVIFITDSKQLRTKYLATNRNQICNFSTISPRPCVEYLHAWVFYPVHVCANPVGIQSNAGDLLTKFKLLMDVVRKLEWVHFVVKRFNITYTRQIAGCYICCRRNCGNLSPEVKLKNNYSFLFFGFFFFF